MSQINVPEAWKRLTKYFTLTPYLLPQDEAEQSIRDGVSFHGVNLLMLIVAIFIASLGLNTNSTAVIIGAMLISPLMGPIIGMGLAVGIHDFELMKHSFRNLMMATVFSVLTSCVYFMISPVSEGHSELLARTSPTIYDVFIGFFGGAAGILAIGTRIKGNVVPGVAIATALMPPLCTVGYGLATLQMQYFLGALYLFFINSVFIAVATVVGVRMMKYSYKSFANEQRSRRVRRIVYTVVVLTMIPAIYMTYSMYRENNFLNDCNRFVNKEFNFSGTQVVGSRPEFGRGDKSLTVLLMGAPLNQDSLTLAMEHKLEYYGLAGTRLRIIQGAGIADRDIKPAKANAEEIYNVAQTTITRQLGTIDSLSNIVTTQMAIDTAAVMVMPEVKVLFPDVVSLAVARTMMANAASNVVDTVDMAIISSARPMSRTDKEKLSRYLETRLDVKHLRVVETR